MTTVARLILGGVLIVAGWLKVGTPAESAQAVQAYKLLPDSIATTVGYILPTLELVVGVLLVVGLLTRAAGAVGALLMLAFVLGIAWAWSQGLRIDCGCFGGGGELEQWQDPTYLLDIVRDFGLMALGIWIVRFPPGRLALDAALGLTGGRRTYDDAGDDEEPDTEEKD